MRCMGVMMRGAALSDAEFAQVRIADEWLAYCLYASGGSSQVQ